MSNLLIVDDNDKYARLLDEYFSDLSYSCDRAYTGREGLAHFNNHPPDHYAVIVTDITMETQTAGLWMLKQIRKAGYKGTVVVASTGYDVPFAKGLTRIFFGNYGIHYLVPKTTVLTKKLVFYPLGFFRKPAEFREITAG